MKFCAVCFAGIAFQQKKFDECRRAKGIILLGDTVVLPHIHITLLRRASGASAKPPLPVPHTNNDLGAFCCDPALATISQIAPPGLLETNSSKKDGLHEFLPTHESFLDLVASLCFASLPLMIPSFVLRAWSKLKWKYTASCALAVFRRDCFSAKYCSAQKNEAPNMPQSCRSGMT